MYFIDFMKNIVKKSNIGVFIWLVLNTIIVTFILGSLFENGPIGYTIGAGIYIVILFITLSPIGEAILRLQNGCKKIKRMEYIDRLTPLFTEVYEKAKKMNPEILDNVKIFMTDSEEPNAFATGRRTICISKGLLKYPDEQIKAVLAHEFGHLAHKDTDAILIVSVGNLIVSAIFIIWRTAFTIASAFFTFGVGILSKSLGGVIASFITSVFIDFLLVLAMKLWTKLGVLICMHSSRKGEKLADEYSLNMGYGESLCRFLDGLGPSHSKGLWAALYSTHPDTDSRIAHLQELGCAYRA